jgi:hypothetical protein
MEIERNENEGMDSPKGGFSIIISLAVLKFLLHFAVSITGGYGIFRDEYYYLACSKHLALGYVDHPPLSIILLAISNFILGDSLLALRILPAVAGALVVFFTGAIIREMGGGKFAQVLGCIAVIAIPGMLGVHNMYSMNAFDHVFWILAFYIVVRLLRTGDAKLWLCLGLVLGFGLQNKISVLLLGLGLVAGLLLTNSRRYLKDKHLWIAGLIAVAIFLPYIIWQIANGWPTLEFIANASQFKMVELSPGDFLGEQIMQTNPVLFPLWLSGLVFLLFIKSGRKYRMLGIAYLAVFIVMAAQKSKPYYLLGAYPVLMAAGAVAWERMISVRRFAWLKVLIVSVIILSGVASAPFALPILPEAEFIKYQEAAGMKPSSGEIYDSGDLPQHFADMHGWENMAAAVSGVYHGLSGNDKSEAVILAGNYGEAASLEYYGEKYDLPDVVCNHNSYWHWGYKGAGGRVVIALGWERSNYEEYFEEVVPVDTVRSEYSMPYESNLPIFLCRRIKIPLGDLWPRLKFYI